MQENAQENNNFESIISSWRRYSGEQVESSAFVSMSGDSPNHQPFKKKEEESNVPILERPRGPIATAASAGTAVITLEEKAPQAVQGEESTEPNNSAEKQEKPECDKEENKDAAGDGNVKDDKDSKSFLDNFSDADKTPENKFNNEKGDNVDSVYLRPPPTHKVRSNASSTNDDEDCGIKCLYYTLQCCDCVLM